MPLFKPDQAFGLPKGTIRALIGMALVGTLVYCVVRTLPIPEGFSGMAGLVIGYYFGKRTKEG